MRPLAAAPMCAVALASLAVSACAGDLQDDHDGESPSLLRPAPPTARRPPPTRASTTVASQIAQPFTIAVLPDTQYYAQYYPEIFQAQTRWLAAHHKQQQIALVVHEGDIVNSPEDPTEWGRAARYLRALDGLVPYALARGNHDLRNGNSRLGGLMDSYFPVAEYLRYPWFRETFETSRMENNFLLVPMGGTTWVVLTLEYGPRDLVLDWAADVLKRHAHLPAIIVTHAYLYGDNSRYDAAHAPHQLYNPKELALEGGANDGEEMWRKLVSQHDNVLFVLSGHVTEDGTGVLTSTRPSGSRCHQILANYQSHGAGGDGYLRLMRFDPAAGTVRVTTYSPYLDQALTDADNQFSLALE